MNVFIKSLMLITLFLINVSADTVWIKSGDGLSATTSPSPYKNDSDASESLTITGASLLNVTIVGEIERFNNGSCTWDWVTVTDNNGAVSQRYCDNINASFQVAGPTVTLDFHSDGSVTESGVTVSILEYIATAVDDSFSTSQGTTLTENVFTNDIGPGIKITSANLSGLVGTITSYDVNTGNFTYVPASPTWLGIDTFTYTITDSNGATDTATVTITVDIQTTYATGTQPFLKVNPPDTWNIRGDYKIAGNTMLCLTGTTTSWTGTCRDNEYDTNNNAIAKYINVDSNSSTWNSSSSYITLPSSYKQDGGQGILWAGLFWSGRISRNDAGNRGFLRMGVTSGSSFTLQDMTDGSNFSVASTDANRLLLKVDSGNYSQVKALELSSSADNTSVVSYAAYADVTAVLQTANLNQGKHVFTVANLTHTEGQESGSGNFGGWSLVVIYNEDFNGKPRNISIYSGLEVIQASGSSLGTPKTVKIEGFKLPSSGNLTANLSIFAGEGEWRWGPPNNRVDWMKISDQLSTNYVPMPGAIDSDNIFDGKMTNIQRDNIANNRLVNNNVGVEIDDYDVSAPMQVFRDTNPNIDTIYLQMRSSNDYINPTMMVFSTELYTPKACFDYTYDFGGHVIDALNGDINTSLQNQGLPLTTHLSIRSLDGDFNFVDTKVTVTTDERYLTYQDDSAYYAPNGINGFIQLVPDQINNISPSKSSFTMSIGRGASPASTDGGTISAGETHFMRYNHELNTSQSKFNTHMTIALDYFVDYGSGPVPIHDVLDPNEDNCTGADFYQPEWGIFNVIADNAPANTYNLPTEIADRTFNVDVRGYGNPPAYTTPQAFNTDIEVEAFNVEYFKRDANLSCMNPDSNISLPRFVRLSSDKADFDGLRYTRANKNSGFRMWYLEDKAGTLVNHNAPTPKNQNYFANTIYPTNYSSDGNCTISCNPAGSGCYDCLRKFYGKPICSRDNFSIRPETFRLTITDNGQWYPGKHTAPPATPTSVSDNTVSTDVNLVAGYRYQIDIKALLYGSETAAKGYSEQSFAKKSAGPFAINEDKNHTASVINRFDTNINCNNFDNESFRYGGSWDGLMDANYSIIVRNVGEYKFHVLDNKWTEVDNPGNFPATGPDCLADSSTVGPLGKVGCNISSNLPGRIGTPASDLMIKMVPYTFDMSTVLLSTPGMGLIPSVPYMYSNQLDNLNTDQNMSISFYGQITAKGADDNKLSNFVTGCYSQDLALSVNRILSAEAAGHQLRWRELNASLDNGTFALPLGRTATFSQENVVTLTDTEFAKDLNGSTNLKLHVNFDRNTSYYPNTPHNPISLNITSLDTKCSDTASCTAVADQDVSYESQGTNPYAQNIDVFYGRAHAPRYRVPGNAATVAIYYEVFCGVGCNIPRLQVVSPAQLSSVDDVNWFQNTIHTQAAGNIPNVAGSVTTKNPAHVAEFTQLGTNRVTTAVTNLDFTYDGTEGFPFKSTIVYIPGQWLIYSRFNLAATANDFELEFTAAGAWAGKDNSLKQIDSTVAPVTNRRIQW